MTVTSRPSSRPETHIPRSSSSSTQGNCTASIERDLSHDMQLRRVRIWESDQDRRLANREGRYKSAEMVCGNQRRHATRQILLDAERYLQRGKGRTFRTSGIRGLTSFSFWSNTSCPRRRYLNFPIRSCQGSCCCYPSLTQDLEMPKGQIAANRTEIELLLSGVPEPIYMEIEEDTQTIFWRDRRDP